MFYAEIIIISLNLYCVNLSLGNNDYKHDLIKK